MYFFGSEKTSLGRLDFLLSARITSISAPCAMATWGARNLIANQALDLLNRAFQGEALMVPPIWSDIPLITVLDGKNKMSPSMFFAAPIKNKQGQCDCCGHPAY